MVQNRYFWGGLIIVVLVLANIVNFIFSDWGLITVRAHEVPLGKIIKSIESQGRVTIYTNIDPTTPVSMQVIKVPLAEAMETLAANASPAPGGGPGGGGGGGAPGGGGPGGGRRGGGGGAQWKLAFFTAPTSSQIKEEIRAFQGGGADDDHKTYSYPTPLQMLSSDSGMPAADPRLQVWSGIKAPPPAPAPPANPAPGTDAAPAPEAPAPPSTVSDYLDVLAQSSDIWIMSPSTWDSKISAAPDAGSSISSAVKSLVGHAHGSVEQAFVLYTRQGGRGGFGGGRGFGGGDTGWTSMEDRMQNAINGLPADARADALTQLNVEVGFQKQVRAAPPEQRRQMMMSHFADRMSDGGNWRRSPEKRAQMYSRVVSNRQAAIGK